MRLLVLLIALAPVVLCSSARAQVVPATVLLVSDSINDRIMMLDATTGEVLLEDYIVDPVNFGTPVHILPNFDATGLFISDQVRHVVHEYDVTGAYVGVFAPAGGQNTAVMQNVRGIQHHPDGEHLVITVASGDNANSVIRVNQAGAFAGYLVAPGAGGLNSPWDVLFRDEDVLVSASGTGARALLRYGYDGAPLGVFVEAPNFPQQITTSGGNVFFANFSPLATRGLYEYTADAALVHYHALDALLGAPRGIHVLPNGNLLTAGSAGIYEIDREAGTLVSTKHEGGQYRYISEVPTTAVTFPSSAEASAAPAGGLRLSAPYPNPARNSALITLTSDHSEALRVAVYDVLGREVLLLHEGMATAGQPLALRVETAALAAGAYVVRASGARVSVAVRLTVTP